MSAAQLTSVLEEQLRPSEEVLLSDTCKLTPFLLRICPFFPDFMIKRAILAVTNERVLLIHLKNVSLTKKAKRTESFPVDAIAKVKPSTGLLTSKLKVRFQNGQKRTLRNLSRETANWFAGFVQKQLELASPNAA